MNVERQDPPARFHRLEKWVHYNLLTGLILSGLLLVAGLAVVFWRHESRPVGPPMPLTELMRRFFAGDGVACLDLGLLVLMLTPVLRVGVLSLGWSLSGERRFAAVALTVLLLLGLSLALGLG